MTAAARSVGCSEMERFPGHTEADIYPWAMRHRHELEQRVGHDVGPAESAADYAAHVSPLSGLRERLAAAAEDLLRLPFRLLRPRDTPQPASPTPPPDRDE